jgi:hypothetical protein
MAENTFQFVPPGGLLWDLVGPKLTAAATIAPTHMIHHVTGTTAVTTITVPHTGFAGPLYLIADSVFSWTSAANIVQDPSTTLVAGCAYGFVYDYKAAKWSPIVG